MEDQKHHVHYARRSFPVALVGFRRGVRVGATVHGSYLGQSEVLSNPKSHLGHAHCEDLLAHRHAVNPEDNWQSADHRLESVPDDLEGPKVEVVEVGDRVDPVLNGRGSTRHGQGVSGDLTLGHLVVLRAVHEKHPVVHACVHVGQANQAPWEVDHHDTQDHGTDRLEAVWRVGPFRKDHNRDHRP